MIVGKLLPPDIPIDVEDLLLEIFAAELVDPGYVEDPDEDEDV